MIRVPVVSASWRKTSLEVLTGDSVLGRAGRHLPRKQRQEEEEHIMKSRTLTTNQVVGLASGVER